MRLKHRKLFLLFLSLCLVWDAKAQILENYNSGIVLSKNSDWFQNNAMLQVRLDLNTFPTSSFQFKIPGEATVFVGNNLWFATSNDTVFSLPVLDLSEKIVSSDSGSVMLTLLKKDVKVRELSVKKGFFDSEVIQSKASGVNNIPEKREKNDFNDFFYFSFILILLFIALYKVAYPSVLRSVLHPVSVFTADDFAEGNSTQKFFSLDVIFYVLVVNMLITLMVMLFIKEGAFRGLDIDVLRDLNSLFLFWLVGTGILTLISVVKFIFLRMLMFIFDLGKMEFAHYFYLLRVISISVFVMSIILSVITLSYPDYLSAAIDFSIFGFFWAYVLGVVMLFAIMINKMSFKNYHLFAYICTAEFVPFLIISKLIVG